MKHYLRLIGILILTSHTGNAQIEEDKLGAWYIYFFNTNIKESPWGFQGDVQYRNWNVMGDLEQLLLRGGLTYQPKASEVKFTLGYGNVTTGTFGISTSKIMESRIYQEALFPAKVGGRVYTTHRFRYEQRFTPNQDFKTRYRYNLFVNVPINHSKMEEKTLYLSFYNEVFINGNTDLLFDRNRLYLAMGYVLNKGLKVQLGIMDQTTNSWRKKQLQLSLHQTL